jgi:hypothetical protein
MEGKMRGYIYIAANAGLPDLVKIGFTTQSPERRISQFSTGSPHPFVLTYSAAVANPRKIEQAVHAYFAHARVNKGREFFAVTAKEAISAIHGISEEVRKRDALAAEATRYRNALAAAKAALKQRWERHEGLEVGGFILTILLILSIFGVHQWSILAALIGSVGVQTALNAGFKFPTNRRELELLAAEFVQKHGLRIEDLPTLPKDGFLAQWRGK